MGINHSWGCCSHIDKIKLEMNLNKDNYKNILNTSFENKASWNYYKNKDIELTNPFESEDNSKEFIKRFIELARKAETNDLFEKVDKLGGRAIHVVCTFFLGIYLYENNERIKERIIAEIYRLKKKHKIKSDIRFSYIWFLICLFHDLGYDYENSPIDCQSFKDYFKKVEGKYLKKIDGVPLLYESNYKKYFDYRLDDGKVDHGICAAFILYRDLCKIRNEQFNSDKPKTILCWEEALDNVYSYASWVILAHNIWFVKDSDECAKSNYKKVGLQDLIFKENNGEINYPISIGEHPFLFLFCLVDSIEPFKIVKDISLLDEIMIEVKSDQIILESNLKCGCHDALLNKAVDLNNWLTNAKIVENKVIISVL